MYDRFVLHYSGGPLHLMVHAGKDAPETLERDCLCAEQPTHDEPNVGVAHYRRTAIWSSRLDDERTLHAMYRHDPTRGDCDCR